MAEDTGLYQKFGRTIDPGQTIFQEGDSGDQMFIIQDGNVRVSKNIGGRDHILAILAKGDFFGEMAIVNNVKRTATITAVSSTELLCFNRDGFVSMINKNPKIALNIIDKLCKRIQHMNMQAQHLAKRNAKALTALNLSFAFQGEGQVNSQLYYDRTVEDISLNLEIPLEKVKSYFTEFEQGGIIDITGNQISLSDVQKLSDVAEAVSA